MTRCALPFVLAALGCSGGPRPAPTAGVAPIAYVRVSLAPTPGPVNDYPFGSSKADVEQVAACTPYQEVRSTGGLECANYLFEGVRRNISFDFKDAGGLSKIQVWFAEHASREDAKRELEALIRILQARYGAVESSFLPSDQEVSAEALLLVVDAPPQGGQTATKAQLRPRRPPDNAFVFASVFRETTFGYYVFLYYQPPR